MMRTKMAALAAGLLLVSAPAFAGGDHTRINSGARSAPEPTQGANAGDMTENTRTARVQQGNSWNQNQTQNQSAGEATPAAPDAGLTPQTGNTNNQNTNNQATTPAQPY